MGLKRENVFVSIVDETLIDKLFATEIEWNLEIAVFSLAKVLDGNWRQMVADVKQVFKKYPVRRILHGPVADLHYHSGDMLVREVARKRIVQGLQIAGMLGAEKIVYHSTYNPMLSIDADYNAVWLYRSVKFWKDIVPVAKQAGCQVVIENVFDRSPAMIKKLVRAVDSPYVKACVDIGHAHIFGDVPLEEWPRVLKKDLSHMHAHDNHKKLDEHLGLGRGTIPLKKFFTYFKKYNITPTVTIEIKKMTHIKGSFAYLDKHNCWA